MISLPAYVFAIIYIVVDLIHLAIAKSSYERAVKNISGEGIPKGHKGGFAAGAFAVAAMAIGWLFLVVPAVLYMIAHGMAKWKAGLLAGAVYGLVVYGVFNGTMYAAFRGWDMKIFIQDIVWGMSWTTVLTLAFAMTR